MGEIKTGQGRGLQWSLPKRTLREADNSLQRTEAMFPTCPLFEDSTVFVIIIDEAADICDKEQVSICVRHVAADFIPVESFLGFVETASTCGESLYELVMNVLCSPKLTNSSKNGYEL